MNRTPLRAAVRHAAHPTTSFLAGVSLLACLAAACAPERWSADDLAFGTTTAASRQLEDGRRGYAMYCAGCHGERGDGNGPAARFLSPPPRDFRKGKIKFASVPAGSVPRDEDLLRVLERGLPGSAMPSFSLLSLDERRAIVAYLKTFSPSWQKPPGAPVAIGPDPFRKKPEAAVAMGEALYHGLAACSSCHAAYVTRTRLREILAQFDIPFEGFRDNLYEPIAKDSEWGYPIRPPDFLFDRLKNGSAREDLVRTIAAGVGGTAMPAWGNALTNEQLWALAYYVESLVARRDTPEAAALRRSLEEQHQP